ncbi:MAG: hypothetical protein NWR69_04675, partial [Flavobacteriales bacterium]|nr:hypothetical protein [Flavobacteriales bacterium]
MKKTCFALLALGLMLTSTSSFAQSFATIGGASTLTSTSTGNDPIDGYYASFRYQVVYTAAELTAAGMVPNASITGLGFSISADYAGGNLNGYTIGLGHTTATNAAAHNTAATTTVKNAFAYNPSVVALGSFDMITFDNSFVWDGSSNILINICTPGFNAYTSPYGQVRVISAASGSRYVRSDFADQCGVNTTNSNSNKPAISFAYSPPPACASLPNAPVASLTGATSICSGFTTAMTATGFSIASGVTTQWMVSNTPGGPYSNVSGGTGATTSSYTSAALTAGTYYFVCTSTCTATAETSTSNEIVLTVNALPTVTLTAPNGGAFCGVQTMTATGASSYVWSPSSALSATSGSSVDYIGTSDATITVTGTDANGCVGSIAQAITYVAPEAITLVSTVPNFCGTGGVSTITASSAGSYVYNFESLETAVLSNTTANTVDATVSQTSAIRVTGTDAASGCVAQSTLSIGLYPLPSATVTTTADGVCPGTQATINSGLSAGNFSSTAIPYAALTAPVNAVTLVTGGVATPSVTGSLDDGGWGNIPVGFTFDFFGVDYTTINIGTNGTLMFGPLNTNGGFGNPPGLADFTFTTLPSAAEPRNMVAVLAMDNNLNGATGGTIKYWTTGFAPNRKFVVSYENVKEFGDNQFSTAQAIFYETTGVVEVHVFSSTNVDRNKLVGINNSDGTIGSLAFASGTVANATNPIVNPIAYRFTPPSDYITIWEATPAGGTTIGLTNNVDGSTINTINGFSATVAPSVTTTYSISYTNATTFCSNALAPSQVVMEVLSNVSPAGVTATSTLTTVCPDANIPLATDYTGITDGLTYQWQVSTDGGANWTDITDATAATYTATQSVASSFRLGIASCGGTI